MNTENLVNLPQDLQTGQPQAGLPVRTGLRAGDWNCNNCQGTVSGSQLFRPTCEYCQPA